MPLICSHGYTLSEIKLPESPAEIIWGEVALRGNSKLILGGYYRTPSGHAVTQQQQFEESLQNLQAHSKNNVIILGVILTLEMLTGRLVQCHLVLMKGLPARC